VPLTRATRGVAAVAATSCPRVLNNVGVSPQRLAWCSSGGDGRTELTATGMPDPAALTSR
jgi:hypothetical protein